SCSGNNHSKTINNFMLFPLITLVSIGQSCIYEKADTVTESSASSAPTEQRHQTKQEAVTQTAGFGLTALEKYFQFLDFVLMQPDAPTGRAHINHGLRAIAIFAFTHVRIALRAAVGGFMTGLS